MELDGKKFHLSDMIENILWYVKFPIIIVTSFFVIIFSMYDYHRFFQNSLKINFEELQKSKLFLNKTML